VKSLQRRMQHLEDALSPGTAPTVCLLWDDEVMTCPVHPSCVVERASGAHHRRIVRLSWSDDHE